jgi:hypothetical protein
MNTNCRLKHAFYNVSIECDVVNKYYFLLKHYVQQYDDNHVLQEAQQVCNEIVQV